MDLVPDTVTSFFKAVADSLQSVTPGFLNPASWSVAADDSADGGLGAVISGLAGAAAALAVALLLMLYFRGYRSGRDMIRHGLAAVAVLGLLAFVAYDMRQTALDYLGINPSKPQARLEIQPSKAVDFALVDARLTEPS